MTLREKLEISLEFEAFRAMIARFRGFEEDDVLVDRLKEIEGALSETTRYMRGESRK